VVTPPLPSLVSATQPPGCLIARTGLRSAAQLAYHRAVKSLVLAIVLGLSIARGAVAEPSKIPADAPVVKLLKPGKGPKQLLRFTASKGHKRANTMTMDMAMSMAMGGNQAPVPKIPRMRLGMELEVTNVASNGDIRYEFKMGGLEVIPDKTTPAAMVDTIKAGLKGVEGMKGHAVVSNRGFTLEADIQIPATANPQVRQLMEGIRRSITQLAAPVPQEPVGAGAKWQTTMRLTQEGMTISQTAISELVELAPPRAKLKLTITQSAKPQTFTSNGVSVDLVSYAGTGSATSTLDLASVVPSSAEGAIRSKFKMKTMGEALAMTLELAVTMTSTGGPR
jgi:hypothetical protein